MSKLHHFWNGKTSGILGALIILTSSIWMKLRDKLTTLIVRGNFASCGKNVTINSGLVYRQPRNIHVGECVTIARNVTMFSENPEGKLWLEDNVIITFDVRLDFSGCLRIGRNTVISKQVIIETHDHGLDPHSKPVYKSLDIGENVWIGMGAIILSSVRKIGSNSIIASGAVVTKEVPSNCIVGGIPARVLRYIEDVS